MEFEVVGTPAWPCNEAAKGECRIEMFWQVFHACEQKLREDWMDCVEFGETVELQRTGTCRGRESTRKSSAEN